MGLSPRAVLLERVRAARALWAKSRRAESATMRATAVDGCGDAGRGA